MSILELLREPFEFGFMTRAFVGVSLIAILSGLVGTFIMLKGLAFIGDAIAHASFGGIVLALLIGVPLHIGAFIFGFGTALLVNSMDRRTPLRSDTSLAILFTGAFALGVLGLATRPTFAGDLSALLVGSVLAIRPVEMYWIVAAAVLTFTIIGFFYEQIVFVSFDPAGAHAVGFPVTLFQSILLALVALAVVVSLQAVGAILVVSLLITPAATASLLTKRMNMLILLSVGLGLVATWLGLYISYYAATPPGATIVTIVTLQFVVGLFIHKARHGSVAYYT